MQRSIYAYNYCYENNAGESGPIFSCVTRLLCCSCKEIEHRTGYILVPLYILMHRCIRPTVQKLTIHTLGVHINLNLGRPKRDREAHLNYYASAYINMGRQLTITPHDKTKSNTTHVFEIIVDVFTGVIPNYTQEYYLN